MWQFGELGYDVSINENGRTGTKPLKWTYQQDSERAKLWKVYQQLGALKSSKAIFRSSDFTVGAIGAVKRNLITQGSDYLLLLANPDIISQAVSASFPKTGIWYDYFSGKSFEVKNAEAPINLLPGEFHILTNVSWNKDDLKLVPWTVPDFNILGVEVEASNFQIYPNPAQDFIQIEWNAPTAGEAALRIMDGSGREIFQKNLAQISGKNAQSFSTQNLHKGLYFIQLNNDRSKLVIK
jgi:hypothetical protein